MHTNTCRLWIDAPVTFEAVQAALVSEIAIQFKGRTIACDLDRNDDFDPCRKDKNDFISTSAWTAWLETLQPEEPAPDEFEAGICRLIFNLRKGGFLITAACDFEDRVIVETGWNWTAEHGTHPWPTTTLAGGPKPTFACESLIGKARKRLTRTKLS